MSDDGKKLNGEDSEARLKRLREGFAKASDALDHSARGKAPPARRNRASSPAPAPQPSPRPSRGPTSAPGRPSWRLGWWTITLAVAAVLVVVFAIRDLVT